MELFPDSEPGLNSNHCMDVSKEVWNGTNETFLPTTTLDTPSKVILEGWGTLGNSKACYVWGKEFAKIHQKKFHMSVEDLFLKHFSTYSLSITHLTIRML